MGPYFSGGGGGGGGGEGGGGGRTLAHGEEGGGGGGSPPPGGSSLLRSTASTPRLRSRGILLLLGLCCCCCGLYVLMYHRVMMHHSVPMHHRVLMLKPLPATVPNHHHWNASAWQSSPRRLSDALNRWPGTTAPPPPPPPLLTLFTTWSDGDDRRLLRKLTLRNWAQLRPWGVRPVLLTNASLLADQARAMGWDSIPVSRTAVGVPVLKDMYLDVMARFNSTLYAFANGDILFTRSLVKSLLAILTDPSLPLGQRSPFVVGQRTNVFNVTDREALTFDAITAVAKARGKRFATFAEDFFITDRRFDWDNVPAVVIGRVAYDNWLVLNAIQKKNVVVDVSSTVLAVHQTTKAGTTEGRTHRNSSYNHRLLTKLYKHVHYMRGYTDCAPWRTLLRADGSHYVDKRNKTAKYC